ncbi:hypothetical protein Tco_0974198 [Tanacetum coccineum]|uniref:Uncharacterized protein n=1 Tax=Tanacetum coccineum TaxID=301880 RepID=A0ABQ5EAY6_9ASTR
MQTPTTIKVLEENNFKEDEEGISYQQTQWSPSDREAVRSQKRISSVWNSVQSILFLLIFKKSSTNAQDKTRSVFTQHQTCDKKPGDQNRVETHNSGLKVTKQRSTLNDLIGMQPTITSKKPTIALSQRAVVYRDRNDQRKLMRLNELHKFSDGTLTRVMEKLDQMVKDFHLYEYNKGMETRKCRR